MQLGLHGKEVAATGQAGQQEEPGALTVSASGRCGRGRGGSSEGRRGQVPPADGVPHSSTRPCTELVVSSKFSQKCKQSQCNFSKGQNPEWCRDWKNIEMEHWDIRQCKSSH